MDMGLTDKVAIVTGAAQGVGRAIALGLAAEGGQVVVADVKLCAAERVVAQAQEVGGKALAVKTDVSNGDEVEAMVQKVMSRFARVDVLVNNAGVVGPQGPWADLTEEGFDRVVGINLKGPYLCSKAVAPHLMAQKSGRIINIASCAAKTGEEFNGVYSATKAAVANLTQSLAFELAPYSVNVNAVCPAAMDTDLMEEVYRERSRFFGTEPEELRNKIESSFRLPDTLKVEDVANLVVFLASDKARMMTGQALNITGGLEVH